MFEYIDHIIDVGVGARRRLGYDLRRRHSTRRRLDEAVAVNRLLFDQIDWMQQELIALRGGTIPSSDDATRMLVEQIEQIERPVEVVLSPAYMDYLSPARRLQGCALGAWEHRHLNGRERDAEARRRHLFEELNPILGHDADWFPGHLLVYRRGLRPHRRRLAMRAHEGAHYLLKALDASKDPSARRFVFQARRLYLVTPPQRRRAHVEAYRADKRFDEMWATLIGDIVLQLDMDKERWPAIAEEWAPKLTAFGGLDGARLLEACVLWSKRLCALQPVLLHNLAPPRSSLLQKRPTPWRQTRHWMSVTYCRGRSRRKKRPLASQSCQNTSRSNGHELR